MNTIDSATSNSPLLQLTNVEKIFGNKDALTTALQNISLNINKGEFVSIMGPSGSGKSTLLNCIATIEPVTAGKIVLDGSDITGMRGGELSQFRRDQLGFIFQDSNLLDTLTGYENIALALTLKGTPSREIKDAVMNIAQVLDITDVLSKFPQHMSGGQQQRIAAARAIISNPKLILADEPTGALDTRNSTKLLETLYRMNTQMNATILMVTHDAFAASYSSRTVFIRDGKVFNEIHHGATTQENYYQRIMEVETFLGGEGNAF